MSRRLDDSAAWAACCAADRRWALGLHQAARWPFWCGLFVAVSRLGDGPMWALCILALPALNLFGRGLNGTVASLQMLSTGVIGLALYKLLKQRVARARPYADCPGIRACTRALDHYSFPSGHTLHAVAYAVVLGWHFRWAAWVLAPYAVLVALSRVVLGLHYPSDVVAGAITGGAVATAVLWGWPW
jgi:undecaprenyl-diphosphatase